MSAMKILGGDFGKGQGAFNGKFVELPDPSSLWGKKLSFFSSDIEEVALANEANVKKFGGAAGWGVVGGLALGPLGLLAGVALGGNKKEVTFVARFKDGRKFLATVDNKTYTKILGATM